MPLPTSLDGVWVVDAAEDSGRSERGRGMWEVLELSKSGSLPLPMVLLGVPLKVPVCDILMPGRGKNTTKGRRRGGEEWSKHEGMRNRYEQRKWANSKGSFPVRRKEKGQQSSIGPGVFGLFGGVLHAQSNSRPLGGGCKHWASVIGCDDSTNGTIRTLMFFGWASMELVTAPRDYHQVMEPQFRRMPCSLAA